MTQQFGHPSPTNPQPPKVGGWHSVPITAKLQMLLNVAVVVVIPGLLIVGAVVALLLVTLSQPAATVAATAGVTSAAPTAAASVVEFEPGGANACTQIGKLYGTDGMVDPDKLEPIGEQVVKSTDADTPIRGGVLVIVGAIMLINAKRRGQ